MVTTKSLFQAEGLDDRSLDFLVQALERNNLQGFDYYEFKRAVYQLVQMQMEEATAYKSAFTTASTLGVTKEKLVETAAYYRDLLDKEKAQFAEALDKQMQTKVASKEAEVKRLRDQIERHKADIARLNDEMGGYLNQIEASETTVKAETEKLAKAKSSFEHTHAAVLLNIDRDVENLHKHL
jgi:chromosome segregation ATPase